VKGKTEKQSRGLCTRREKNAKKGAIAPTARKQIGEKGVEVKRASKRKGGGRPY